MPLMRSFASRLSFLYVSRTSLLRDCGVDGADESRSALSFSKRRSCFSSISCVCLHRTIITSVSVLNDPQTKGLQAVVTETDQKALVRRIANEVERNVDAESSADQSRAEALLWALRDAENEGQVDSLLAGFEFPLPFYSSVIQKLGKEGRCKAASLLLRCLQKRADEKERKNVYLYTSLLGAFAANRCVEMANLLVEEMTEMGVTLNVVTYNTIMGLYKKQGRYEEALGMFSEMQKSGVQPSFVTYSYVFKIFKKTGNFEDALDLYVKIKMLFDEKKNFLQTTTNMEAFHLTHDNLETMKKWVVKIGMKRILNGLSTGSNKTELAEIFQKMKYANLNIGRLDCRILILHCGSNEEDYFLLKAVFGFMMERGFLDVFLCNHILKAFGEGRKFWAALEVFEHMVEKGPPPSPFTYKIMLSQFHVLLSAACRRKIWKWALQLIDRMIDKGIEPDSYAWNMTLAACAKAGKTSAAVEAFQKMIERGAMPDAYSYGSLLSALEKEGLKEKAEQVWHSMRKVLDTPNDAAYTMMISLYGKVGEYDKAMDIFQEMQNSGVMPTVITYNALITACAQRGDGEGALFWLEAMKKRNIAPDSISYQELIKALASGDHWKQAATMYIEMRTLGLKPSCVAYDAVLRAYEAHHADVDIELLGPRPPERKRRMLADSTTFSSKRS